MSDKDWLLNAAAIRAAKECIKEVEANLEVRLSLTHPEFLQMLNDYSELCESPGLTEKVNNLNTFAATSVKAKSRASVVSFSGGPAEHRVPVPNSVRPAPSETTTRAPSPTNEMVTYQGKTYPKFYEGREFKGLYRGQPKYG